MKKKLFIGSSKESIKIAEQVKAYLVKKCSEWLEVSMWNENGIFELNKSTLDNLKDFSRRYDYGVFIADADDTLWSRRKKHKVARDNVIFELGMFIGSLGQKRAFALVNKKVNLPSDLKGPTVSLYEGKQLDDNTLHNLTDNIEKTRDSYRLGHRQSSALAYGYFNNFILPMADTLYKESHNFKLEILIPKNISDLCNRIQKHIDEKNASIKNINGKTIHAYPYTTDSYWDIPRQLKTLEELVGFYTPCSEPGRNPLYDEDLNAEIQNYYDALQYFIKSKCAFKENIAILWVEI